MATVSLSSCTSVPILQCLSDGKPGQITCGDGDYGKYIKVRREAIETFVVPQTHVTHASRCGESCGEASFCNCIGKIKPKPMGCSRYSRRARRGLCASDTDRSVNAGCVCEVLPWVGAFPECGVELRHSSRKGRPSLEIVGRSGDHGFSQGRKSAGLSLGRSSRFNGIVSATYQQPETI